MKRILIIISVVLLILSFSVSAYAIDFDSVWASTDEQTKEYLEDLGIYELTLEEIFELSPTRVVEFLIDLAFDGGVTIIKNITTVFVVLVITAIASSFLKESDKTEQVVYFVSTLVIISILVVPISRMITDAAAGIKTSTVFVNAYLPVMTAIIIASKNPALAATYNSFSLFLSSLISNVANSFLVPCISSMLSFNILSSFSFENYRERIIKAVRKMIVIILSLFSTVYTGLLTTQSILATSSDSVALKGIKFISGAFVPIVGGGVGDAISSVFSSFVIMKNTLGVFVIIVIILINLPVMLELLLWYFALSLCSIVSSMFNLNQITDIIDSLASILSLLNIIMFFITFVLIISTGVIIMMGK